MVDWVGSSVADQGGERQRADCARVDIRRLPQLDVVGEVELQAGQHVVVWFGVNWEVLGADVSWQPSVVDILAMP